MRARPMRAAPAMMRTVPREAAIVGAGPAGLLTALMLAQRGWEKISIFDSRPAPPLPDDQCWGVGERSYQLGLNGRGQKALRTFGAFDRIDKFSASVNGRLSFDKDWKPVESRLKPPGTPGAEKSYVTRVLQRDRLQSCLLEDVRELPQVDIRFGIGCNGVDISGDKPRLDLCKPSSEDGDDGCDITVPMQTRSFDLVVGADGVRSSIRESLAESPLTNTKTVRFENRNERRYKTLPLHPSAVSGTSPDLNWGSQNKSLGLGMDALPTMEGEMVAVLLFKPETPVRKTIESLSSGAEARRFLRESLPALDPYLRDDDLARFVKRPISRLPSFQLVQGDIHYSLNEGGVVLLGDSIKAVKPYFGQGANSALEDVVVLSKSLEDTADDPAAAAASYNAARAEDARALVKTSRSFDGRGPLGTARFLLPLLLDIQLNKRFPALFSPPMLRGLQDERNTFSGLRRRKRRERALLLALLAGAAGGARAAVLFAMRR